MPVTVSWDMVRRRCRLICWMHCSTKICLSTYVNTITAGGHAGDSDCQLPHFWDTFLRLHVDRFLMMHCCFIKHFFFHATVVPLSVNSFLWESCQPASLPLLAFSRSCSFLFETPLFVLEQRISSLNIPRYVRSEKNAVADCFLDRYSWCCCHKRDIE